MKYDVFISYSRKDTAIANKVCAAFDKVGISYFIDRQGIGGGLEFPRVLAENIIDSHLFLLLASENAYASKFTTSEIVFAFNKMSKQSILQYIVDGSSLPLELEFTFAGINWRNIADHPIEPVLVSDIMKLLGRSSKQTHHAGKTYKVGDYYDVSGKQGVVVEVRDGGRHGKIVSIDEEELTWNDSFVWCRRKGAGWYFPDVHEMEKLLLSSSVHDAVNHTLKEYGGTPLNNEGDFASYWSSSERDDEVALYINLFIGCYSGCHKYNQAYVRAMAEF